MTFTVIPVSEARRVTRVVVVDRDEGRFYEILEAEGALVRAHPPMDLHGSSLADAATLKAAVEGILENSTRAQADWNEQSDFEGIAEAATEADRLLAPSEVVPRDLDEDERQWRSDVARRQEEIKLRARALPRTPVMEIGSLSREIEGLVSETAALLEHLFERPLRPRSKVELETELERILPETQLRDLDLDRETVASLATRDLFTVQDVRGLDPKELGSFVGGKPLKTIRAALRSINNDSNADAEGWSKLPPRIRKILEEAGYSDFASLAEATQADVEALPGLGPKGMSSLEEHMMSAGATFAPETRSAEGAARSQGTVKWFSTEKGFGFIAQDGGEDVFVHLSALRAHGYTSLGENQRVEFEVTQGQKGPKAENVRVI